MRFTAIIATILFLSSCNHITYRFPHKGDGYLIEDKDLTLFYFFNDTYDYTTHCHTPARLEHKKTFVDQMLGNITLGIYNATSVWVECSRNDKKRKKRKKRRKRKSRN